MTKLTLTITASPAAMAQILQAIPSHLLDDDGPVLAAVTALPNAPSIPTGTGIPVAPAFPPFAPTGAAPTLPADEDDEPGVLPIGDTDAKGLRWDERIHSGAKTVNRDGSWKKRKNVDAATLAAVEAELRSTPAPLPVVPAAALNAMPIPVPVMPLTMPIPVEAPQPIAMPVAQPAPMPVPVAPDVPMDMMSFMGRVAVLSQSGAINAEYIASLAQKIAQASGEPISNITEISGKQHLIDYAVTVMKHEGVWS